MTSEQEFRDVLRRIELDEEESVEGPCQHSISTVEIVGYQLVLLETALWLDGDEDELTSWSTALEFRLVVLPAPPRVMPQMVRVVTLRDSSGTTWSERGVRQTSEHVVLDHGVWEHTSEMERIGPGAYMLRRTDAEGSQEIEVEVPGELLSGTKEAELIAELLAGRRDEVRFASASSVESPAVTSLRYKRIEPPEDGFNVRLEGSSGYVSRWVFAPDGIARRGESAPDAKYPMTARTLFIRNECK